MQTQTQTYTHTQRNISNISQIGVIHPCNKRKAKEIKRRNTDTSKTSSDKPVKKGKQNTTAKVSKFIFFACVSSFFFFVVFFLKVKHDLMDVFFCVFERLSCAFVVWLLDRWRSKLASCCCCEVCVQCLGCVH